MPIDPEIKKMKNAGRTISVDYIFTSSLLFWLTIGRILGLLFMVCLLELIFCCYFTVVLGKW